MEYYNSSPYHLATVGSSIITMGVSERVSKEVSGRVSGGVSEEVRAEMEKRIAYASRYRTADGF